MGAPSFLAVVAVLVMAGGALAYFTSGGAGVATASIAALTPPQSPAAATAGTTVTVTWNAATINGSVAATSYSVERYTGSGTDLGAASCSPVSSSTGQPNALGSFSCTDSPPPGASYEYKITANYGAAWSAGTGFTNAVIVQSPTALTATGPATGTTNAAIAAASMSSALSGATTTAGGTVTVKVFGPQASAPTTCTTGGTTVGTASATGNGTYHPSTSFTPTTAGTYWWYASYSGDTYNAASSSTCGAGMASTAVTNATATTATAPSSGTAGTAIAATSISSALSGATAGAGGTVTFKVFGPQASAPTTCSSGGTTAGTAAVSGNATYHPTTSFTPTAAGTYWWYASYSGDTYNAASSSTCGAGMASTAVGPATTAATAAAPASGTAGTSITSTAITSTLSGGSNPTGTITFKVFGPQASAPITCTSGGTTVGTATVTANGTYQPSTGYTPPQAGSYWWYASYGGDTSNTASTSTCGSTMAKTVVAKASPTLSTAGPATDVASTAIAASSVSASLAGGASPTGTITYKVFGPQASAPTTCTTGGTTVGTASAAGNGSYSPSAGFTPPAAGDYWWYASYPGDANNNSAAGTCGAGMAETVVYTETVVATATNTKNGSTTATTGTFTLQPNTTYLLFAFRTSAAGDGVSTVTPSGFTSPPSLSLVTSTTGGTNSFMWAEDATTGASASGSGTIAVTFNRGLAATGETIIDVVQLGGNNTTTPIVTASTATTTGSSTTATANLKQAPAASDAEAVFFGAQASLAAPTTTLTSGGSYTNGSGDSAGFYSAVPAQLNSTFTLGSSVPWLTIALEIAHG